jgi:glutamate-1-semialdehyde 2,1-aminomutase
MDNNAYREVNSGCRLYEKAKKIIPGGTQLLSKRPEMFLPDLWPAYYEKAKGCEVWDLDGNKYFDMITMGIGACILGYADEDVNNAVKAVIDKGSMSILNAPEEVELAELLCSLHPWAGMVRYTRGGGEAMTVAVRIARAKTQKDKILFCGYHGWHDWYLSANLNEDNALDGHLLPGLSPRGIPRALQGSAHPFVYNDTKGFRELVDKYKNEIGVIVLEAIRNKEPEKDFINAIMDAKKELGIVFVVDEITSGWRMNLGGAHLLYGIEPDIAVFAKAISNGFPMGAIIGKKEVMEAAQETFISSTYWTERIGPAAAIATIKKMSEKNVSNHLVNIGKKIQQGWETAAVKNNLSISASGIHPLGHFEFKYHEPLVLKTLFTQMMFEKGFLAGNAFYASYAHKQEHIEEYLRNVDNAFSFIADALKEGRPEKYLRGPICHSGFKRLT